MRDIKRKERLLQHGVPEPRVSVLRTGQPGFASRRQQIFSSLLLRPIQWISPRPLYVVAAQCLAVPAVTGPSRFFPSLSKLHFSARKSVYNSISYLLFSDPKLAMPCHVRPCVAITLPRTLSVLRVTHHCQGHQQLVRCLQQTILFRSVRQ